MASPIGRDRIEFGKILVSVVEMITCFRILHPIAIKAQQKDFPKPERQSQWYGNGSSGGNSDVKRTAEINVNRANVVRRIAGLDKVDLATRIQVIFAHQVSSRARKHKP